jgi:hypothetical protein
MEQYNIKTKTNYRQALEKKKNKLMQKSKQRNKRSNDDNSVFSSCLFTCKLNSTEANYKGSTSMKKETTAKHLQTKYKTRQFIR